MKRKYKFVGRYHNTYLWKSISTIAPTDSRYEQIACGVDRFWGRTKPPASGAACVGKDA